VKWTRDGGEEEVVRTRLPLPADLRNRLAYTVDSILTIQGGSFLKDAVFDWAPPAIYQYRSGGRKAFLSTRLKSTVLEWFMMDLFETIVAEAGWNIRTTAPLSKSSFPLIVQFFYTICFGMLSYFASFMHTNTLILVFVGVFHSNPDSWPPIWRNPWEAHSLAEFWGYRWHWSFRRSFVRAATPILRLLKPALGKQSLNAVRLVTIFGITTIYHLGITMSLEGRSRVLNFWEPSTIKFFMSQPFGILIELWLIKPLTESLSPRHKSAVRRAFVWVWLVYTGRWYADQFIKQGFLEEIPPFFPIHTLYRKYWTPEEYLGWGVAKPGPYANPKL